MEDKPVKVSVLCTAYNHEPYLRRTLESFVMQQTDFPFEVLVNDDASTDGSAAIIREYAELYPEIAPNTVNNFLSLVKKGFYDGVIFHRVIPGFMIQGGDPQGTGMGGPGYCIRGEFTANGFQNDLKHERGVLSMARTMAPDTAGSQFFIMHKFSPHLDGQYAAFGKVISGMDVVDRIAMTRTTYMDKPVQDQRMVSVTADEQGVSYPEPEKC